MSTFLLQVLKARADPMKHIVSRLLNAEVISISPIGDGRNSQLYRVLAADSRPYALKVYFRHASDSRDRLGTEFSSLSFLWEHGERQIPKPIAIDPVYGCAVYEYIDGESLFPEGITENEMDTAITFLGRLKNLSCWTRIDSLCPASDACFSGQDVADGLYRRLARFSASQENEVSDPALRTFLSDELAPACDSIVRWSRSYLGHAGISFEESLGRSQKTLSPSDFGFHNALRRYSGELVFLDFEYFGWDDPAKMVADFLLHPAMSLSEGLKQKFVTGMVRCFNNCPNFPRRLEGLYPLFGLKWCFILLNEFLPEHILRRQFARPSAHSWCDTQKAQLAKAKQLLKKIKGEHGHFPYFN